MEPATAPEPDHHAIGSLRSRPALVPVATELFDRASRANDPDAYLAAALPAIAKAAGADYVALAVAAAGKWAVSAEAGSPQHLPVDLLAEVLDRESAGIEGGWAAAPLAPRDPPGEVLVLHGADGAEPAGALCAVENLAPVLQKGLAAVRLRHHNQRRIRRLEATLEIANQWNQ
ncbi:MAG: hypothetical protein ACYSWU_11720, partial [Planctomycetota bacterium]